MAIDVKDLPPAYQAQALRKWVEQERDGAMEQEPRPLFQVDKSTGEIIGEGAGE